ncbi:aldehyde ferredoxin oxidoreductase family protein [Desulfosporosinus sp.]|uniref:aldehyde ferredoxin oxidoreductase family protein n=1 Tax=Desulfosporosinus sp. TaxID=157907 RepID=UPI0025C594D4|nr:aldehyde ferredoxin oxidoreductase C-terminal domain-containing protein [Desulfosporosinus sp.]MBC2725202.1 aldehyde:ferredoxin oxidoreductase [Desulfosporosinus sp.]
MNLEEIKNSHKLLGTFNYQLGQIDKGYTNRTLYVNLSANTFAEKPVTKLMKQKFIGGRGFGLKLLWDSINDNTKWNDPENELIIAPGPIGGITQYPGAGKSYVVGLSPLTQSAMDSNVGGYFGPFLKFSGWDALEIQGKAERDVILFIDGTKGTVTLEEAPLEELNSHILIEQLTEMYAESEEDKVNVSVVTAGEAAQHTLIGLLNFSFYDTRRKAVRIKQAGRGGLGTVFRDKNIKALVIKSIKIRGDLNNPHDLSTLKKVGKKMHKEILSQDDSQCQMRKAGTTHIVKIMNDYDLLPVRNYKFGSDPNANNITHTVLISKYFDLNGHDECWYGCTLSCAKVINSFKLKTGPYKDKDVIVDGPEYETLSAAGSVLGVFDPEFVIETNFYCDTYGVDTISFGTLTAFVMECYENGVINQDITGGLKLNFGNAEAALELLHQMAKGEGFGVIAGLGIRRMKKLFIEKYGANPDFLQDIGMEVKGLEFSEYVTKESLAQQGGYGLTNKGPQHDEAWVIFMDMVNNQIPTFEDKAEALFYYPMFRTWFSLVGLCKLPWNDIVPADNHTTAEPAKVPEHVQNYVEIYNGVTGSDIDNNELIRQSEVVYNFHRVFNLRMGYGTREFDQVPYRAVGPVTAEEYESRQDRYDRQLKEILDLNTAEKTTEEKVQILRNYREEQYQKLCDAVYLRRGWNSNGIPTLETLQRLGIDFPEVAEVVKKYS